MHVRRLKRFRDERFSFGPLSILTGTNGGGKTTAIHGLLLARLAAERRGIDLGDVFGQRLGEAADLLNFGSEPDEGVEVRLGLSDAVEVRFEFEIARRRTQELVVRHFEKDDSGLLAAFLEQPFSYLCADRLGPRDVHETNALNSSSGIGPRGELVAQILAESERQTVPEPLRHSQGATASLGHQVEAWLSSIVRPTEVQATWFPNASAASLRFRAPGFLGEWVRPINAGFGLTAAIPIVVAGLTMAGSGVLVVENPEAHLHPQGQSEIGRFLARVAASGTQVIMETHSDHVLNGVRRAVALDGTIAAPDVSVHFLDAVADADGEVPRLTTLGIGSNGEVSTWPESFFDQIEKDLGALAGARRRRP